MGPSTSCLRLCAAGALLACVVAPLSAPAQTLVGVTGDGAVNNPASLFTIDPSDASTSFLMSLGSGGGAGEAIGFNPDDDLLYHASGDTSPIWERIDPSVPTVVSSGPFTGDGASSEKRAMVHDPATGRFLVADSNNQLLDTTLSGVGTAVGTTPESLKGLAFSGGALYASAQLGAELYELDPDDGAVLSTKIMTLGGVGVAGSNGLASHPQTGQLWLVYRVETSTTRYLGTVDPATGVVSPVGALAGKFAGIAFLPEPGGAGALGAGLAALLVARARGRRPSRPAA